VQPAAYRFQRQTLIYVCANTYSKASLFVYFFPSYRLKLFIVLQSNLVEGSHGCSPPIHAEASIDSFSLFLIPQQKGSNEFLILAAARWQKFLKTIVTETNGNQAEIGNTQRTQCSLVQTQAPSFYQRS
jgi:hypothetical protein